MTPQASAISANRPLVATYPPGTTLGPRPHRYFEFIWIITGGLEWTWLDADKRLLVKPGTLLFTQPDVLEHIRWDHTRPSTAAYVNFDINSPSDDSSDWPLTRPAPPSGLLSGMLDHLLWLATEPTPDWQAHVDKTIATLLDFFLSAPLPDSEPSPEPAALAAALDHVQHEWAERMRPISLEELATAGSVSKEHLARLFRQHFGTGMIRALELVRLSRAETLLIRSNLSVTFVAASCGYQDVPHFSRRFRATYGVSPRRYRELGTHQSPLAADGLLPLARRVTRADERLVAPTR